MLKEPFANDPNFKKRQTMNSMIIGWICASIEPKVKSIVMFIPMHTSSGWS